MEQKVVNKGGRPPLNQPKSCTITGAFTEQENGLIKLKAHALGITKGEYVSKMANNGKVIDTFSPEQRQTVTGLIKLSNNINQLVKLAHTGGINSIVLQLDDMFQAVRILIKNGR